MVGDSFSDAGSFVSALWDGSPSGTAKTRLENLKADIKALEPKATAIKNKITPDIDKAKTAVQNMANELGTTPFTWEAAARGATELAYVLIAFDDALGIVAHEVAEGDASIENQIRNITKPWKDPFIGVGNDVAKGFNDLCKAVLDIDNAGSQFADHLLWDRAAKRLALVLEKAGSRSIGALSFDGASVEAFFAYKDKANLGVTVKAKLKAGLRSDKLLEKIIPGEAPTADTDSTAITLDTTNGLTFGDSKNHTLILPVRFSFPGIELREMSLALPVDDDEKRKGRLDVMMTIAGKLGDVIGAVTEGGGITLHWSSNGSGPISVKPKPPYATGLRVDAGVVKGGGFLRYKEDTGEYGGVLDLQFTKIGVTAIGLIGTHPSFSLVVVIGVHFLPKIELGFGFTLSGLGGLLAIERRVDTDALRKDIRDGTAGLMLFPENPVDAAPKILDTLGTAFPVQAGGFVVGPMAELGWGSQAGFVKAKIGIVLALPDPKVILLGTLDVGVPSADIEESKRIVKLHAEILGEFTPDYLLFLISLTNSKIATIAVSGDIGLLIRWNGGANFAMSVGGFFPKYTPPPELADLRRIALQLAPPVDWLKVRAEGYFAITANSVQFGGRVTVSADLGPVSGEAWLGIDSLFQWTPRFYFIFMIDAGMDIKAFGHTLCGVSFRGQLSGMHPWRLEGHASATILFWDVNVDIGPIEWGERDTSIAPSIWPVDVVAQALTENEAWKPQLPANTDTLARFIVDDTTPLLVHPLGALEVRQIKVPLETQIDRIGSSPVTAHRVNLADPQVGGAAAAAVSHSSDLFAPGHYINMSDDRQASSPDFETFPSGMRVNPASGAMFGEQINAAYEWETFYPHEEGLLRDRQAWALNALSGLAFRTNAVAQATRARSNPYLMNGASGSKSTVGTTDAGRVTIRRKDDLTTVAGIDQVMNNTQASTLLRARADRSSLQLVGAGV